MPTRSANSHRISTLNEKPLHADLKAWYARPGDRSEVLMDGFLVDIVRDGLLVEIQTRNVSAIRRKLSTLAARHPVRLVYPIARERWIVRAPEGEHGRATRRKSPRRGLVLDLFEELVSIPKLPANANFSLEVLFIREDEVRRLDRNRSRRRHGWVTQERRLVEVLESRLFRTPADLAALIPHSLADPFTTAELCGPT